MKKPGVALVTKKLFAFWAYTGFPGVLGGTVVEMDKHGHVRTSEYGGGMWFTPVLVLPADAGRAMLSDLKEMERNHGKAQREFQEQWDKNFVELFPALSSALKR